MSTTQQDINNALQQFKATKPEACNCEMCSVTCEPLFVEFTGAWISVRLCNDCATIRKAQIVNESREIAIRKVLITAGFIDCEIDDMQRIEGLNPCKVIQNLNSTLHKPEAPKWAYLHGVTGTGKTTELLAFAQNLAQRVVKHGRSISMIYVTELEFFRDLRQPNAADIEKYIEAKVLLLDEVAISRGTSWEFEQYAALINGRYRRNAITVFSSNVALDDLASHPNFGARTRARIMQKATREGIENLKENMRFSGVQQ